MTVSAYVKDPNDIEDYAVNWSLDAGDTITVSTWTAELANPDTAIVIGANSFTNTPAPRTLVRLSAGTVGKEYLLRNRITTAQGKQHDHTLIILCLEK